MARELTLWHPDSPGTRVRVRVRWPRSMWITGPDTDGRPTAFATNGEVLRMYRRLRREWLRRWADDQGATIAELDRKIDEQRRRLDDLARRNETAAISELGKTLDQLRRPSGPQHP